MKKKELLEYINQTIDQIYLCNTKTGDLLPAEHRLAIIISWLNNLNMDIINGEYD